MKERIITAICLLAIVIPIVVLGGNLFVGLGLIATSIATWEMVNMHNNLKKMPIWINCLTILTATGIVFKPGLLWTFDFVMGYVLLMILVSIIVKNINAKAIGFHTFTVLYIGLSFRALLEIRNHSLTVFIFLIAIVMLTDSMAYFVGRFFGKHKLAPMISPKKTIEGAVGGWLAGVLFAIAFGLNNHLFEQLWVLIVLAIGLPMLSQVGDLLASWFKRKYGIKDYGKIFPGHGGVMDRVDSQLLAGILLYVVILR